MQHAVSEKKIALITYTTAVGNTKDFGCYADEIADFAGFKSHPTDQSLPTTTSLRTPSKERHPRTETQRIKWWNLKDQKEVFFASVAPSTLPHPTRSVEEMWSSTSSVIRLAAENTLGKTTLGKPKVRKVTWFWSEEVQAAIREKKSKYKLWWKTRQRSVDIREGERAVYHLVRARHRSTLDMEHTKIVREADGAVLRRSGQILESVEGPVLPITAVEVSVALAKMKSNKATGPDDMPADVWKLLGDRGSVWLVTLFNKIVAEGRTPEAYTTAVPYDEGFLSVSWKLV
ncbi:hypothetical protein RB195_019991 [Necator americanus]|uniref:Uncharacterized protein n=1 Tax=Necator americanus TaxID=51031 RepID=A0ABR1CGP5_NECAM